MKGSRGNEARFVRTGILSSLYGASSTCAPHNPRLTVYPEEAVSIWACQIPSTADHLYATVVSEMKAEDREKRENQEKEWEAYDQRRTAFMKKVGWDERRMTKHESYCARQRGEPGPSSALFFLIYAVAIAALFLVPHDSRKYFLRNFGFFLLFLVFPIPGLAYLIHWLGKLSREDLPEFDSPRSRQELSEIFDARGKIERATAEISKAYYDLGRYVAPHWISVARCNLRDGIAAEAEGLAYLAKIEKQTDEWNSTKRARCLPDWPGGARRLARSRKAMLQAREVWYQGHRERAARNEKKALAWEEKQRIPPPKKIAAPPVAVVQSPPQVPAAVTPTAPVQRPAAAPISVAEVKAPAPSVRPAKPETEQKPEAERLPSRVAQAEATEPVFGPAPIPTPVVEEPRQAILPTPAPPVERIPRPTGSDALSAVISRGSIISKPAKPVEPPVSVETPAVTAKPATPPVVEAPEDARFDFGDPEPDFKEREELARSVHDRAPRIEKELIPEPRAEGGRVARTNYATVRDPDLRAMAVQIHGRNCVVCGFNFDAFFGEELAQGYIEVHHLSQISGGERTTDPATDLAPLCANCHAMADRLARKSANPPSSIAGLRDMLIPR